MAGSGKSFCGCYPDSLPQARSRRAREGQLIFKIKDLEVTLLKRVDEKIQKTTDPLRDKVDAIDESHQKAPGAVAPKKTLSDSAVLTIVRRALSDPRYTWRSIDRLAKSMLRRRAFPNFHAPAIRCA